MLLRAWFQHPCLSWLLGRREKRQLAVAWCVYLSIYLSPQPTSWWKLAGRYPQNFVSSLWLIAASVRWNPLVHRDSPVHPDDSLRFFHVSDNVWFLGRRTSEKPDQNWRFLPGQWWAQRNGSNVGRFSRWLKPWPFLIPKRWIRTFLKGHVPAFQRRSPRIARYLWVFHDFFRWIYHKVSNYTIDKSGG